METPRPNIPQTMERLFLALAGVLVALIAILAYASHAAFRVGVEQADVTRQVVDTTNALLSALKDAETGQRGFLLTGNDRYLEPYQQALSQISPDLDLLTRIEAQRNRPDQAQRVERLKPVVKAKLDELAQTIELRRSQGPDAALAVVRTDRGQVYMEQIRAICAEINAATYTLAQQQTEKARAKASDTELVAVFGSIGLLALLAFAIVSIERGTRRRRDLIAALEIREDQLKESRDWLSTTVASIGDAVITTDAEGRITLINDVAQSLTGWKQKEAAGQSLEEVFVIRNEETGKEVENPVSKVLREGRIVGLANHTELFSKDGRRISIDDSAAPIRDAAGRIAGVVMVFRDITAQRQAEVATRLLASIVASSDDAIISKDLNGVITTWNPAAERIFGFSAAEAVGKPVSILAAPGKSDEMLGILKRIGNGERVEHFETVRKTKYGPVVDISLTVSPVLDAAGQVVGASKIARDITQQVRSRAQIAELAERLRITLSSIGDAVIATDPNGAVTYMNPVAEELTGWPLAEASGKPLPEVFEIVNEETRKTVENPVSKVLREGRVVGLANHTVLIARGGEEYAIDDSAAPIRDSNAKIVGVVMVFRDNTAGRDAEIRLRATNEELRRTAHLLEPVACFVRDFEHDAITYWNPGAAQLYGFSAHEALGESSHALLKTQFPEPLDKIMEQVRTAGAWNGELIHTHRDGRVLTVASRWTLHSDDAGEPVAILEMNTDITARKEAELSLRDSEALLAKVHGQLMSIIDNTPASIYAFDLEERFLFANAFVGEVLHTTAAQLIGKKRHEFMPKADADQHEANDRMAIEGGKVLEFEEDNTVNGRSIRWLTKKFPLRDAQGNIYAVAGISADITERKKIEQENARIKEQLAEEVEGLRALHELGTRLLHATTPALLNIILAAAEAITNADKGTIQLVDASTGALHIEAHHGFSPEFLEFFNEVHTDKAAVCSAALAARKQVFVEDVEQSPLFAGTPTLNIQRAEGVRAIQSTPIINRTGDLIGMLSTHYATPRQFSDRDRRLLDLLARQAGDLIEKARSDDKLRLSNAELARANEDLNQFAFAASHDLQEPLRMMASYSQLLVKNYRGQFDGEAAMCIQFITEGTKRMRELLADLLAYTQVTGEAQELGSVELNEVLRTAVENCRAAIEETGAKVTSDRLPSVLGHKPHFVQLFQNLISNGLKYRGERPPRVHISAQRQDGGWRIAVKDNGMGIAPEYHKHIFGVFKRLHGRTIPGTGIGLAICQRVIERSGGQIWVESELNQGATFYFTLPAAKGAAAHDA